MRPPSPSGETLWTDVLLEQLAELDHLYRMAPVGLCLLDPELRFVRINRQQAETNGKPVSQHIGRTLREVVPEMAPALEPVLRQVIAAGEPVLDLEIRGTTPAEPGVEKDWLNSYYPLVLEDGSVKAVSVVTKDVTELKRVEAALREAHDQLEKRVEERTRELTEANVRLKKSEERFRRLLEAAPEPMILVRRDGTIMLVNEQMVQLFGYRRDELIGGKVEMLLPQRFRKKHGRYAEGYFADPVVRAMGRGRDLFALRKDGDEVPVDIRLSPFDTEEGLLVSASIRDITERKQAEEEARRHREELAHVARVAALGELVASLAHELNQPLAAILSNAQAAQRFLHGKIRDLDEVSVALADIVADNQRAREVMRRLLRFLRKGELERKQLDVNDLTREVMALVRGDMEEKRILTQLDLAADLSPVLGDRIQLQQVILNLLFNGAESMLLTECGPRELVVKTSQSAPGTVTVAVRDSGAGLDEENVNRMFDAFFTTKPSGLGIGLSISRSIVEAHGGRLWATQNSGRGATFHLSLPEDNKDLT